MSETIPRKILVCVRKFCQECDPAARVVPDTCPYRILHPLDVSGGYQERKRQTWKTAELVEMANELVAAGYSVCYITETEDMADHTRICFSPHPGVKLMSVRQSGRHLRGMAPAVILADEITVEEMNQVRMTVQGVPGFLFLAHYWTPR